MWQQHYHPLMDSLGWSTLAAAVPILVPLLLIAYGRRFQLVHASLAAAALFYFTPVVGIDGISAYNDVACAAVVFGVFYLLQIWDNERKDGLLVAIGLLAGFAYGLKYTAGLDEGQKLSRALRSSVEGNLWVASRVVPALAHLHAIRIWAGMNINIDRAPILGEVPGLPGFYNCVSSNGYTLAPVLSRLTTELITGKETSLPVEPYSIRRFG